MSATTEILTPQNFSPLQKIRAIMAGAPGTEAVLGMLMPYEISLFEANSDDASVVAANGDHHRMVEAFTDHDITVFNTRHILGQVLAERYQGRYQTVDSLLAELRRRAELLYQQYGLWNIDQAMEELAILLRTDTQEIGEDAAVALNAVLTNCVDANGNDLPHHVDRPPVANFMFWRDTNHTVGSKIGTHKMYYPIRQQEVALTKLVLDRLGLAHQEVFPNSEDSEDHIEGGDIMPMEFNNERFALIGSAERTSWSAIEAWYRLHEATFSQSGEGIIPIMVQGPTSNTQDEMHLDTFSQQTAAGALIHCREITGLRDSYVLYRKNGQIVQMPVGTYADWMEKQATHVHNMPLEDQRKYAPNVLLDGGDKSTVYITRDGTPDVTQFIREHADEIVELHMEKLTHFYGGAHCATSDIR